MRVCVCVCSFLLYFLNKTDDTVITGQVTFNKAGSGGMGNEEGWVRPRICYHKGSFQALRLQRTVVAALPNDMQGALSNRN